MRNILARLRLWLTPKANLNAGYLGLTHAQQEARDLDAEQAMKARRAKLMAHDARINPKTLLAVAMLVAVIPAHAGAIFSHAGLANSMSAATVAISSHPAWQGNNPGGSDGVWIAPFDAGPGGSVFIPDTGFTPTYTVYDSFLSGAGILSLTVWADNTAELFLDGLSLIGANFTSSEACTQAPIGCRPQDGGVFNIPITAGLHSLEFQVYQAVGAMNNIENPTGLLYFGEAPDLAQIHTPEPAGYGLMGLLLVGLGVCSKKRRA